MVLQGAALVALFLIAFLAASSCAAVLPRSFFSFAADVNKGIDQGSCYTPVSCDESCKANRYESGSCTSDYKHCYCYPYSKDENKAADQGGCYTPVSCDESCRANRYASGSCTSDLKHCYCYPHSA